MSFSVSADLSRQQVVWDKVSRSGFDEPYQIRRQLTEQTVRASDRRAQFVGLKAYEEAGGAVLRDLFEADDGGWLQDAARLDRRVADKLRSEAERIAAEGWKWITATASFPFAHTQGLRRHEGHPTTQTGDEQAAMEALQAEQTKIENDYDDVDELPDEVDQRLGEIETALLSFEERPMIYQPPEMARAGVFISNDAERRLRAVCGFV